MSLATCERCGSLNPGALCVVCGGRAGRGVLSAAAILLGLGARCAAPEPPPPPPPPLEAEPEPAYGIPEAPPEAPPEAAPPTAPPMPPEPVDQPLYGVALPDAPPSEVSPQ